MEKFFTIKNHNDIYNAIGQIIQAAQYWEQDYRDYASMVGGLPIDKLDIATLRRLNTSLMEEGKITEKEFRDLKHVIHLRNYINHEFFLVDFYKDYEWLEEKLNNTLLMIYEASDVVANMKDRLVDSGVLRPTVFDEVKA
jgi:hypothetical protein